MRLVDMARGGLADAIRAGAKQGPQLRISMHRPADNATCAIGAAKLGLGLPMSDSLLIRFPWLLALAQCPAAEPTDFLYLADLCEGHTRFAMLWHLNDAHCWSREQIADWIMLIEQGQVLLQDRPPGRTGPVHSVSIMAQPDSGPEPRAGNTLQRG